MEVLLMSWVFSPRTSVSNLFTTKTKMKVSILLSIFGQYFMSLYSLLGLCIVRRGFVKSFGASPLLPPPQAPRRVPPPPPPPGPAVAPRRAAFPPRPLRF